MTSVMLMPDVWPMSCSKGTQKSFRTSFHTASPAAVSTKAWASIQNAT